MHSVFCILHARGHFACAAAGTGSDTVASWALRPSGHAAAAPPPAAERPHGSADHRRAARGMLVGIALLVVMAAGVGSSDPGRCPDEDESPVVAMLPPSDTKLGLAFYRSLVPPTISRVAQGSLAASVAPSLRPGLQLWSINGHSVGKMSFKEALRVLREAPRPMQLQFRPPPARSATGGWLDHGEVAVAAATEDDAALAAVLDRLREDDAYEVLNFLAPRVPAVVAGLRRLMQDAHSWTEPRLQREAALALTLAGDYGTAQRVLDAIVDLPHADQQDGWRQSMLIGRLQCVQGLRAICVRSLREAVRIADSHGADAALARAALAEQLLQHGASNSNMTEAVTLYRQSVFHRPADFALRSALALALERTGDSTAAREEYNQLLTISSNTTTFENGEKRCSFEELINDGSAVRMTLTRRRQLLLALRDQAGRRVRTSTTTKSFEELTALYDSETTDTNLRKCAQMDCSALTHGRSTSCASGYCLCKSPFYGLRCQHTHVHDEIPSSLQRVGGELSSEYDYLLSAGFQLKQRLAAASLVQTAHSIGQRIEFVLEAGGGYHSVAPYLPSGPYSPNMSADAQRPLRIHHNVEPVARAVEQHLSNGWWSTDLALGFEDYDYRLQSSCWENSTCPASAARSLVVLGFTPTKREYCHAILSCMRGGYFNRVVLEAPAVGDLLGMSALASSMLELQRAGYAIVTAVRLDPCEGWDALGTVAATAKPGGPNINDIHSHIVEGARQRRGARLPPDLHPPDCERFLYVLDRRHRGYSYADSHLSSPVTSTRGFSDLNETARATSEAQMSREDILARAQDAVAFVNFFRDLLARVSTSPSASSAQAICAPETEAGGVGAFTVVSHIAALLADSISLQPLAVPRFTDKQQVDVQNSTKNGNRVPHIRPIVGRQLLGTVARVVGEGRAGPTFADQTLSKDVRPALQLTVELTVGEEGVDVDVIDKHLQQAVDPDQQTLGVGSNGSVGNAAQTLAAAVEAATTAEASLLLFDDGAAGHRVCEAAMAELRGLLLVQRKTQPGHPVDDTNSTNAFETMAVTRVVLEAARVLQRRSPAKDKHKSNNGGAIAFRSAVQLLPQLGFKIEAAAWVEDLDCNESQRMQSVLEDEATIDQVQERIRWERCYRYVVVMQRADKTSHRSRGTGSVQNENDPPVETTKEWVKRFDSQLNRLGVSSGTCLSQHTPSSK